MQSIYISVKNITLVIPAKNESESLPTVIEEINELNNNYKIKIILKDSDKTTIESIKKYNCEIICQKGFGYGDAIIEGINSTKTEYFCIFNADGSFRPSEINLMLQKMEDHNADFIFGSRYEKNAGSLDDTFVTYVGNFFFTNVGKILFKLPLTDILYTFVLGKTIQFKKLNITQKDFTFCVEFPIKSKRNGMKIINYPCYERKRIGGKKKVNAIKDGFLILKHMIYLFFKK